jgi:hypothetical protein
VLACTLPSATTAPTTPAPTVVKAATTVPPKPKAPDNTLTTVQVTATTLHVRTEPMGLRIGYLYHADTVTLTGSCRDGWAQISWGGTVAWVNARFLSGEVCQTNKE